MTIDRHIGLVATLSVWRPLEHNPVYAVLAEALKRHVGAAAGAMMHSPFPDWDGDALRALARDVGFGDVSITVAIDSVRYPSIEASVLTARRDE